MHQVAKELNYSLHFWSVADGLVDSKTGQSKQANDPLEALLAIQELKAKFVVMLLDFHLFLQDSNPILIRQFKDVLQRAKTQNKTLILQGCRLCLPPELEREVTVIEFALPETIQRPSVEEIMFDIRLTCVMISGARPPSYFDCDFCVPLAGYHSRIDLRRAEIRRIGGE